MCSVLGWKIGEWFLRMRWADKSRNKWRNKWYGWEYSCYSSNKSAAGVKQANARSNWKLRLETEITVSRCSTQLPVAVVQKRGQPQLHWIQRTGGHNTYPENMSHALSKDRCSESRQLDELKICIMERCLSSPNRYIFLMNLFSNCSDSWPLQWYVIKWLEPPVTPSAAFNNLTMRKDKERYKTR